MRLVSNQSEDDLALERAAREVDAALREVVANILRVSRGAGASWKILEQLGDLVQAKAHSEMPGAIMFDFEGCLRSIFPDGLTVTPEGNRWEWTYAEERMVCGAMQIVASRFLGQRTQEAAGHNEMFEGLITIERLRKQNRRAIASATRGERKERAAALLQQLRKPARQSLRKSSGKPKPLDKI